MGAKNVPKSLLLVTHQIFMLVDGYAKIAKTVYIMVRHVHAKINVVLASDVKMANV
jgi:hypothetical protein